MNVVLFGATGKAGSRILTELISRDHSVTAVARDISKIAARPNVNAVHDDLSDVTHIASLFPGADAVVSAYGPPQNDTDQVIAVTDRLVQAILKNNGPRLLVVGGAGSLFVAPGITLLDSGHLPEAWIPIVKSHAAVLANLRKSTIDWTYFSPAAFFEPGERTGHFRLGTDDLISNDKGESRISMEDYAIALVDELETPRHRRARFTAGY